MAQLFQIERRTGIWFETAKRRSSFYVQKGAAQFSFRGRDVLASEFRS